MSRRPLAAIALVLFLVVPVSAQKRRAVRSGGAVPPPASNCHTFGLVKAGLEASYLSQTAGGDVTFTITWISDTPTRTVTKQRVTTPQATTDVDTVLDGEIVGSLRGLKHLNVKTVTAVPILGNVTTETDIDFVPSLVAGPAAGWCTGNTWTVPPVTETIVSRTPQGQTQQVVTTIASTGEVLAVNESLTVPAGSFNTVKYRGATISGTEVQTAITWVSTLHNIVVRQDTLDSAGKVTSTTRLTAVR